MKTKIKNKGPFQPSARRHLRRAWLKLAAGVGMILLFMFGLGPLGLRLPGYSTMSNLIRERDLRATAIYYTDIEEFADAETGIYHSFKYAPKAAVPGGAAASSKGRPDDKGEHTSPTFANCP